MRPAWRRAEPRASRLVKLSARSRDSPCGRSPEGGPEFFRHTKLPPALPEPRLRLVAGWIAVNLVGGIDGSGPLTRTPSPCGRWCEHERNIGLNFFWEVLRINGSKIDWFDVKPLIIGPKHKPLNQRVQGSSPCAPTNDSKHLRQELIDCSARRISLRTPRWSGSSARLVRPRRKVPNPQGNAELQPPSTLRLLVLRWPLGVRAQSRPDRRPSSCPAEIGAWFCLGDPRTLRKGR